MWIELHYNKKLYSVNTNFITTVENSKPVLINFLKSYYYVDETYEEVMNMIKNKNKSKWETCEICDVNKLTECKCCGLSGEPNPEAFTRKQLVRALEFCKYKDGLDYVFEDDKEEKEISI